MMQEFTIPGRLMGRNEQEYAARSHWSKAAEAKKSEQERVIWAMKQAGIRPVDRPVELAFDFYEKKQKNGSLRDHDNIRSGAVKVVQDAMKEMGIIRDDNPRMVRNSYAWFAYNQPDPRVVVKIFDYDPNGRTVRYPPIEGLGPRADAREEFLEKCDLMGIDEDG